MRQLARRRRRLHDFDQKFASAMSYCVELIGAAFPLAIRAALACCFR